MTVTRLRLLNFQSHDALDVALGPGLTLVLGDNGAGKSSILEGVCWALYGRTVRGSNPWRQQTCRAIVDIVLADGGTTLTVERMHTKNAAKARVTLAINGVDATAQTNTDTNSRIALLVGSWERFTASRVFTREQVARFGTATDAERKDILEGALGMRRFDLALGLVRDDLRQAERDQTAAATEVRVLNDRVSRAEVDVSSIQAQQLGRPDVLADQLASAESSAATHEATVKSTTRNISSLRQTLTSLQREYAAASALAQQTTLRVQRARPLAEKCDACGRPFGADALEHAKAHRQAVVEEAEAEAKVAAARAAALEPEVIEVRAEVDDLDLQVTQNALEARKAHDHAKALAVALERAQGQAERLARALAEHAQAEAAAEAAVVARALADGKAATLVAVEAVLGLRGARVALLEGALVTIEQEANAVLSVLADDLSIQIAAVASSQKAGALERRQVVLTVTGAGGGDYAGASAGERARIDIALLLGLGAVAGAQGGFAVFDEVFDALDKGGVERAATFLSDLNRQALVISHHPDVIAHMPRAKVLHVKRGTDGASEVA